MECNLRLTPTYCALNKDGPACKVSVIHYDQYLWHLRINGVNSSVPRIHLNLIQFAFSCTASNYVIAILRI